MRYRAPSSTGRQACSSLAGVWVGLAFQAKMIEAWLVLPALGLAYLVCGPGRPRRRVRQLVVGGVVAAVVSLSWMTAVTLVPASHRPYVDGSHDDSVYAQVFVYNGFGRFGEQTPLQLLAGQGSTWRPRHWPGARAGPAAARRPRAGHGLVAAGGRRRGRWGHRPAAPAARGPAAGQLRAVGAWLVTLGVAFSLTTTINAYYTAALTPAVAALLGAGVAAAWSSRRATARLGANRADLPNRAGRAGRARLAGLAVVAGGWPGTQRGCSRPAPACPAGSSRRS